MGASTTRRVHRFRSVRMNRRFWSNRVPGFSGELKPTARYVTGTSRPSVRLTQRRPLSFGSARIRRGGEFGGVGKSGEASLQRYQESIRWQKRSRHRRQLGPHRRGRLPGCRRYAESRWLMYASSRLRLVCNGHASGCEPAAPCPARDEGCVPLVRTRRPCRCAACGSGIAGSRARTPTGAAQRSRHLA